MQLNMLEEAEFIYLGVALAQMSWLTLFSEVKPFREGVGQGKGRVSEWDNPSLDSYDCIIYYRLPERHKTEHPKVVMLDNLVRLQQFVSATMTELYRRGIIK